MEGLAAPATHLVPAGMPGHDATITLPPADLARARALMAEAGLPNGFRLLLHGTTGRYPNDQRQAETMAQMLARIGIEAQVQTMPLAVYFTEARRFAFSFNLVSWGFTTGDTYVILREALRSDSANNYGRYAHPAIDAALDAARVDMNPERRAGLLASTQRQAAADIAYIPTHFQVNVWAGRADLAMTPRMDEGTLAHEIRRR
jgi:peptide/nickel transport system substrate-binding protein